MGANWTQTFPPKPAFTEKDLQSLKGKVFIITGGNAGIGFELAKILYAKGGTVYITGRSSARVAAAITTIQNELPSLPSTGELKSLVFDLSDLATIPNAAKTFLAQESRLDVLFNNAGIAQEAPGSLSVQGYEAHMGTNCLGPFLFTKLLEPIMIATAKKAPKNSVRIVFASSGIVDLAAPPGGVDLSELASDNHGKDKARNYASSKAGNWLLASEFDKRLREKGIISVTQNPGNLKTNSWKNVWILKILMSPLLGEPIFGAYTNLWCGLSDEIKAENGGRYAIPFGRWHPDPRKDILESLKGKDQGGTGVAAAFYDWCEKETATFAAQ